MENAKIALVGSAPFFDTTLRETLEDAGFEVTRYMTGTLRSEEVSSFSRYDLFILSPEVVPGEKGKGKMTCHLSIGGSLFVGWNNDISVSFSPAELSINPQMSPEEILHQVNSVIYRTNKLRKSPRITVRTGVEYECVNRWYRSEITTISLHGLFISTLNPPPEGSLLRMFFSLPGGWEVIEAAGRVLYSININLKEGIINHPCFSDRRIVAFPGMGVLFEGMSKTDGDAIQAFIEDNSG